MSHNEQYDNDDYVAKLLAEDAKKSSHRYAAVGLSALLPKRPTKAAPKPNTRFLTNLVREADSHNAVLKKKEELEAKLRLREMRSKEKSERDDIDGHRERKRQRRRLSDSRDDDRDRPRDSGRSASPRRHRKDGRGSSSSTSPRRDRKDRRPRDHHHERSRTSHRHHNHEKGTQHSHHRRRSHSRERNSRHSQRSSLPSKTEQSQSHARSASHSPSSSDPLEGLVRSTTSKPRVRGRGAQSSSRSNIDAHFSSTYDPSLDVHLASEPDSEREDWDMALEALRDRNMWKRKQAERLREAGFGDDEIQKWERKAGPKGLEGDGDVRDVKWKKRGEAREWDIGKETST